MEKTRVSQLPEYSLADVAAAAAKPAASPPPAPAKKKPAPPIDKDPWPAPEPAGKNRWLLGLLFLLIIGLYATVLFTYYAGAQGGVDQAGYLMTARMLAGDKNIDPLPAPAATTQPSEDHPAPAAMQTSKIFDGLRNRLGFVPESPFQFVSRMCVMTEPYGPPDPAQPAQYRVYAKYPPGYPLIAAVARDIWGWSGMYLVNPLCTILACFMAYFLFRQALSPFMSLLGVLWLACNPLVLFYANDANSHSPALLCVVIGFWGLLSWMRTGALWRAWIGGFALGYACTVRYSEFLLVLPVLFAAATQFRWNWKKAAGSLSLVIAWAIPVVTLALICWISFGAPWKTGYSYCKENTGFGWKYLTGYFGDPLTHHQGNWETFVEQLNHTALFIIWGPAVAGLLALLGSSWRLGVTLALWVLPQTLLYMLYYWAPGGEASIGYMRFFMTLMPGFILAALWVLERALSRLPGERRPSLVAVTVFAAVVLLAAALYFNGEPLKDGWAFATQIFAALAHLVTGSWVSALFTVLIAALVAGIWWRERDVAAPKVALALAVGTFTALGCAVNLYNITPQVEGLYTQSVGLRDTIDNTQKLLPPGAALFADDSILNQMDCVGGWKLVNARMFSQSAFWEAQRMLDGSDSDDDPDPRQRERERFVLELLGKKNSAGLWISRTQDELQKLENELMDRYFAEGRRVAFLVMEREGRGGRNMSRAQMPTRKDCDVKVLGRWSTMPPVTSSVLVAGKFGRFGGGGQARPPVMIPNRMTGTFVLYEIVKKPLPKPPQPPQPPPPPPAPKPTPETKKPTPAPAATQPAADHAGELFPNVPAQK